MLGSLSEADDAVQETWLRLSRSDTSDVENLGGWLTTVVARVCLDMPRSRASRREEPLGGPLPQPAVSGEMGGDPEDEALLAASVGVALLFGLGTLAPGGRGGVGAGRQVGRVVRHVFLAAARGGAVGGLLVMRARDVVPRADQAGVRRGAPAEVMRAAAVASTFSGRARAARSALLSWIPGAVWAQRGEPRMVFSFRISAGKITRIHIIADPGRLGVLDFDVLRS